MSHRYAANVGLSLALIPGNPAGKLIILIFDQLVAVGLFFVSSSWTSSLGLEPEYGTLPELLKSEGYTNHLVGKWHLGQSKVCFILNVGFRNLWSFAWTIFIFPQLLSSQVSHCRRNITLWGEVSTRSTAFLVPGSTTGQNNKAAAGDVNFFFWSNGPVTFFFTVISWTCQVWLVARLGSCVWEPNSLNWFAQRWSFEGGQGG